MPKVRPSHPDVKLPAIAPSVPPALMRAKSRFPCRPVTRLPTAVQKTTSVIASSCLAARTRRTKALVTLPTTSIQSGTSATARNPRVAISSRRGS